METFTYKPTLSPELSRQPRILTAQFGDGYAQEVADGINNTPETWNLVWNGRNDVDATAIEAFFVARGGWDPFLWTPPGASAAKQYKCKSWKRTFLARDINHISATFTQDFSL